VDIALPRGYALNEYRIESTLGIGGFGVTYLATDNNLNLKVAIKEYLPGDVATRAEDHSVRSKSQESLETFNWGRTRFLEESRTLASFRHPNIVRVMRFFEANRTAYMVMEFVAGEPLQEWIRTRRPITEPALIGIAAPLLDGLEVVHRGGYLHRDIKPENIFIRRDGSPVLIDFGSARAPSAGKDLTTIVSLGFAPFEQYHARGGEGPWTDLYALGGVLYWMITGERPVEAPGRAFDDPMVPAAKVADASRFSMQLLKAIDWALTPAKERRPQSVVDLRDALPAALKESTSEVATTIVMPHPKPEADAAHQTPLPRGLDSQALVKIAAGLATYIGPIASQVVRSQARKSVSLAELVRKVAAEIPDEKERAAFVRKYSADERPAAAGDAGPAVPSRPQGTQARPETPLDAAALARAEAELAQYVGAVARVLVRRAAAKAHSQSELYHLLAEHVEDSSDRKAFVRKGLSISGRRPSQ
jgi:serine/threonine protein kinase